MIQRRYIFGLISAAAAVGISACSNGGGNNNNNPCNNNYNNQAYYNNGMNNPYNNGMNNPYATGGCTGVNPNAVNANLANRAIPANNGQQMQQIQLQAAMAESDATRLSEELREERNARKRRNSDDDSSSSSDPTPVTASVTVTAGTVTPSAVPVAGPIAVSPAPQGQQYYNGTQTQASDISNVAQNIQPQNVQPTAPAAPTNSGWVPVSPTVPTVDQGTTTPPADNSQGTSSTSGGVASTGSAQVAGAPVAGSVAAPAINQESPSVAVSVIHIGTLQSNTTALGMQLFSAIDNAKQIAKNTANDVIWVEDSDYETQLTNTQETPVAPKTATKSKKKQKKTKTAAVTPAAPLDNNPYLPKGIWNSSAGAMTGLWQDILVSRMCDLDSADGVNGVNGACIVLERDERGGKLTFRGYVVGGYNLGGNYKAVRQELPASVMPQIQQFLGTSAAGIYLFTPR